jgi:Xaa-Pro aminopeptidase
MRYNKIDSKLYIENRKNFAKHLKPGSIAIFTSNDIMPTNADGAMGFRQNADLLYLSGIDQEETMLIIFPDVKDGKHKEVLFIRETSELIAIWEGAKFSKLEASEISGIEHVYWTSDFDKVLTTLVFQAENIYLNSNEHMRRYIDTETQETRLAKKIKEKYPLHRIERAAPIMHRIRSVKNPVEAELIKQACNITEKGFRRILNFIKPGVFEYEIEAELMHEFLINRSRGFAYSPIIASGFDSCVLHYVENNKACKDGDIILLDVAAEYANYASDLTRVVPVNGKFTQRQKDVYNAVLRVHRGAAKILTAGNTFEKYNAAVGEMMTEELLQLGLLKSDEVKNQKASAPAYKKYFMHGTSHFLGLDVHDVGFFHEPMQAGNVFTIEPGIYIREENLGVRIENNFLITASGAPIDLMANIPIEAGEIEELMNAAK